MPMVNGQWQEEDAGVESRVAGMVKSDSPLMKAAQADALKIGNKRGLMNSSMTARAGTRAALDVAVPIASQEAGQIHARNLSGQQFGQEGMLQGKRIESQEKLVGIQEEGMNTRLGRELTSRENISAADRASRSADLLKEITSREGIARDDRTSRETLTGRELTSREGIARDDRTASTQNAAADRTSRETIARDDRNATQTTAVANAVAGTNNTYTSAYAAIMSNPNIPADERANQLRGLETRHNADVTLIEGLYNVDLDWGGASGTGTGTPAPVAPTLPYQEPNPFGE